MQVVSQKKNVGIWHYLMPHKLQAFFAFLAIITTSSAVLGIGKGIGYFIDNGLQDASNLNSALFTLLVITLILAVGIFARFFLVTYIGEKVIAQIRQDVYSHLIGMPVEFFEKTKSGEILSLIAADTTLIQVVIGSSVAIAIRNSILFLGGIVMIVQTSFKLASIVGIVVPLVVIPIVVLGKRVRRLSKRSQERLGEISSATEETIYGIKTIKSFVQEKYEKTHFTQIINRTLHAAVERIALKALLTSTVIILVFGAIAAVLWVGGHDVINGKISSGHLSSFIFYAIVVAGALGAISEVVTDLQRAAGASERIFAFLKTDMHLKESDNPTTFPPNFKPRITFENVDFVYPSQGKEGALKDISFEIEPGKTIAFVGPSGAGKTTIFQVLLRFYDLKSGKIRIDGVDISNLNLHDLRNIFALVPQDPVIFSASIYDNIAFARPSASYDEVVEAAKQAAAWNFINELPDGINSYIGEKGVRLSGGQKQRVSIARAFLKDPKILLLDEATSALDAENEKLVQDASNKLRGGRTTLVIAHRLATVKKADKIIVIDKGKIKDTGTHDELIVRKGIYSRLAKMQF